MTMTNTHLRIIADYQLFSDMEGVKWAKGTLAHAQNHRIIDGFEVTDSHTGRHGLQFVRFWVDVPLGADGVGDFHVGMSWDESHLAAEALLNMRVIHDTDVQVRWLAPVNRSVEMARPWYAVVETDRHSIVVGPYGTEAQAKAETQSEEGIIQSLVTVDAKRDGYTVEDAYWTQEPPTGDEVERILPN